MPGNSTGGPLHIVLEDENVEEQHILWCVEHGREGWHDEFNSPERDAAMHEIVAGLLALDKAGRRAVIRAAEDLTPPLPVPAPSSEFVNDAVFARFPGGTDPLTAIRESMAVFMERKDGTNALAWWSTKRWWHGGPGGFKRGNMLLPPSQTGVVPGLPSSDRDAVYVTTDRDLALLFAARHNTPHLYEVAKLLVEPSPDDTVNDDRCWRVRAAMVDRVEQPSTLELRRVLYELEGRP